MDKLLEEMFKRERWEKAIQIAVEKNMPYDELEQYCNPDTLSYLYKLIKEDMYAT